MAGTELKSLAGANATDPFCGHAVISIHDGYFRVHGYLSLLVCLLGSVANVLNIAVLTRKDMISPTNVVLTGLAFADLLVLLEYIPFAGHMYLRQAPHAEKYSYAWATFVMLHSDFSQIFHTISIWLTVTLAVWRYIAVAYPQHNRVWCRMETTYVVVALGYVLCPLMCIPLLLAFNVIPKTELVDDVGYSTTDVTVGRNVTLYVVSVSPLATSDGKFLIHLNFLVYSVVFKIIPCIALTVLSLRLVAALVETKRRRLQLLTAGGFSHAAVRNKNAADKERQTDRTTRMLLAVLLLFLVTEFPQGILGLLSIVFGDKFFIDCYQKLGELADILALVNSAINFILYYVMSRQFRNTFKSMFALGSSDHGRRTSQALTCTSKPLIDYPNGNPTSLHVTQVTQV